MRWTSNPNPKEGDLRVRKGFLIFPKCIAGETRWLEYAIWRERFCEPYSYDAIDLSYWVGVRWVSP
jgi:hypothetical protein